MLGQRETPAELGAGRALLLSLLLACWCPSEAPWERAASLGAALKVCGYHGQNPSHSQVLTGFVTEPSFPVWLILFV